MTLSLAYTSAYLLGHNLSKRATLLDIEGIPEKWHISYFVLGTQVSEDTTESAAKGLPIICTGNNSRACPLIWLEPTRKRH